MTLLRTIGAARPRAAASLRPLLLACILITSTVGLGAIAGFAVATHCPGGSVKILETGHVHCSIADAIADASAGQTILVAPGTYAGAITLNKANLVLCSSASFAACDPAPTTTTLRGGPTAITITANGVVVDGFTIEVTGSGTLTGIDATGTRKDVRIENNTIRAGTTTAPSPGENGINGRFDASLLKGNDVTGFAKGIYLRPYSLNVVVEGNALSTNGEGLLTYGKATTILGNAFSNNLQRAIAVGDAGDLQTTPLDTVLRGNVFRGATPHLETRSGSGSALTDVTIDARLNDWGTYTCDSIPGKLGTGSGRSDTFLTTPWLDSQGRTRAPFRLASDPLTGFCGTLQEALDAIPAGSTLLVEPATHTGVVNLAKAVTLCSTPAGGSTCDPRPASTTLTSSGPATLVVTANDVTIRGFTVTVTGSGASLVGIDAPLTATRERLTVQDNIIVGPVVSGSAVGGESGVRGRLKDSLVEGNSFERWRQGVYIRPASTNVVVSANSFAHNVEGILSYGSSVDITGNTIRDSISRAIRIANAGLSMVPVNHVLEGNDFSTGNPSTIQFSMGDGAVGADPVHVVAPGNDWGAYTLDAIAGTIDHAVPGNTVDFSCFVNRAGTGQVCPPTVAFTVDPSPALWGRRLDFTDGTVSGGSVIETRLWDFGDGMTSAAATPSHTYATSGTYAVTLTVTDRAGYEASITEILDVVNTAPVFVHVDDAFVDVGSLLRLWIRANDAEGDKVTYSVTDLPAGATFTTFANGTARFSWVPATSQAGVYGVVFEATDSQLSSSLVVTITVESANQAPFARLTGPTILQPGVEATYTSQSFDRDGEIVQTAWEFSDGYADAGPTVTRTFPSEGIVTLTLTVTDNEGASHSVQVPIRVDATPPTTTASPSTPARNGWFPRAVSISLAAADGLSGVASIHYRVDDGDEIRYTTANRPTFSEDGVHTLTYWAVDRAGNVGAPDTLTVRVDTQAPTLVVTSPRVVGGNAVVTGSTIDIMATVDDAGSGVANVTFLVDGQTVTMAAGAGTHAFTWTSPSPLPGRHEVTVRAVDLAGHVTSTTFSVVRLG